jgi:hypothetical protein
MKTNLPEVFARSDLVGRNLREVIYIYKGDTFDHAAASRMCTKF